MNRGRIKFLVILAFFFGPLLAAFVWYYGLGGSFAPSAATNNAPLISPVVVLEPFSNARADGGRFDLYALGRKWTLIHSLTQRCGEQCETALYNTRQVRLALGKDAIRIQRILLGDDPGILNQLAADHLDAIRILTSNGGIEGQLEAVLKDQGAGKNDALLVDPLGNVMMIIPAALDPSLLLKDLKRLLKVSRIG